MHDKHLIKIKMEDALEALIDYRGKTPKKSSCGISTLSAKSVKNGFIDYSQCYFISRDEYKKFMVRGFPQKGDILLTTEAPLGVVAKLDRNDVAVAQRLLTLRGKKGLLDNDYLLYYLQSSAGQGALKARESGTTVTGIKQAEFRKIELVLPSIDTQKRIASILSSLDDKIKNSTQINHNLEEQAKAIFKSWFVDFEPFQNGKFVDSEWGQIPAGWKVGTFGEIASVSSGKRPVKKSDLKSEECTIPLIGAACIMGFTCNYLYNTPIVVTGRVGTHGVIQYFNEKCWPSDNTLVIQSKYLNFVYLYLQTVNFISLNRGSTQPLITQSDIKKLPCLIIPENTILNFEENLRPIRALIQNNLHKSQKLALLQDLLLPKLMSGEIDVSQVDV